MNIIQHAKRTLHKIKRGDFSSFSETPDEFVVMICLTYLICYQARPTMSAIPNLCAEVCKSIMNDAGHPFHSPFINIFLTDPNCRETIYVYITDERAKNIFRDIEDHVWTKWMTDVVAPLKADYEKKLIALANMNKPHLQKNSEEKPKDKKHDGPLL